MGATIDNSSTKRVAVYSVGGFGREVAWLIESCNVHGKRPEYNLVCFVDDDPQKQGQVVNKLPVHSLSDLRDMAPDARLVVAVGSPQTRQKISDKAKASGFDFETVVHSLTERSEHVEIGIGSVICAGCILTVNIVIDEQVHINLDCTIGHDVRIGAFTTLAPGVHVSGCVHLGKRVYIGTGATIINGTIDRPLIIEDDVVVGAGACVTKSIQAGQTVVGIPARPLSR
jgi:sugar O-acyltransferase (sialic acid O-acetyltransferase NeuD family)